MTITLLMHKEEHTAKDLRLLAQAPYFDVHRIRRKPADQKLHRMPNQDPLTDEELLPAGTPIHSYSIARGTQQVFEKALGQQLPIAQRKEQDRFMDPQQLHALLINHSELHADPTIGPLYDLLKLVTGLGFTVAWSEDKTVKTSRALH